MNYMTVIDEGDIRTADFVMNTGGDMLHVTVEQMKGENAECVFRMNGHEVNFQALDSYFFIQQFNQDLVNFSQVGETE